MPVIFFAFFFLSGFCGLVYQVVWLRMAMADFGVTTPLISIVLSVFMAGLALGSWGAGRLVHRFETRAAPEIRPWPRDRIRRFRSLDRVRDAALLRLHGGNLPSRDGRHPKVLQLSLRRKRAGSDGRSAHLGLRIDRASRLHENTSHRRGHEWSRRCIGFRDL